MTLLFVYDHLMDPNEFKRSFPKLGFRFLGIGRLDNYKISWIAKGIPFVCRKRPTLILSPGERTYGIVVELSNSEEVLIRKYIQYLSNNKLIDIQILLEKCYNKQSIKYSNLEKSRLLDLQITKIIRGKTFVAETSNLILDKTYIDSLLIKGGDKIINSEYFKDIKKLSESINPMLPSDKYIIELNKIANVYQFPKKYIEETLNVPKKQKLMLFESIIRKFVLQYMYLIVIFQLQEIGFSIIDLFWEIDPRDPLVFEDQGNINRKIIVFIMVLVFMSFLPLLIIYSTYVWFTTY